MSKLNKRIKNLYVLIKYVEWFELQGYADLKDKFHRRAHYRDEYYADIQKLAEVVLSEDMELPKCNVSLSLFCLLCDEEIYEEFRQDTGLKLDRRLHEVMGLTPKTFESASKFRERVLLSVV